MNPPDVPDAPSWAGGLSAVFPPDGGDLRLVPFPRAGWSRRLPGPPREELCALLDRPPVLDDLDPRRLLANQSHITRAGVAYYLTGTWERTGRTWADHDLRSNAFPLILRRTGRAGPELVILSGHHRSTAALVEGRPLRARLLDLTAEHPDASAPERPWALTALLEIGPDGTADTAAAAERIAAGRPTRVTDTATGAATLTRLGLDPTDVRRRLRFLRIPEVGR